MNPMTAASCSNRLIRYHWVTRSTAGLFQTRAITGGPIPSHDVKYKIDTPQVQSSAHGKSTVKCRANRCPKTVIKNEGRLVTR
jgi:hypothetical protein